MEVIRRNKEIAQRQGIAKSLNVINKKGGMMTVKSANKKKIQLLSPGAAARGARSPAPLPRPANR